MDTKTRTADRSGRISIGKDAAEQTYEVEVDEVTGVVTLTPQLTVTADMLPPELWSTIQERIAASRAKANVKTS